MNKNCGHWPLEEGEEEAVGHCCLGQMAYLSFRLFDQVGFVLFVSLTYIFVLVTPSFSTKELFSCKMCCVRDFVCVDKMGLVSLSTRSKAK